MLAIGKHFVLARQVGAARVDEVDAGQVVLRGDFLGAQMLLHRDRVISAAFDGRVVGDDHALLAVDAADTRNQAARSDPVVAVHAETRELADLEKRRTRVDERVDALARQHLAAAEVLFARAFAAAQRDGLGLFAQVFDQPGHGRGIFRELGALRIDPGLDQAHLPAASWRAMSRRWMSLVPS